MFVFCRSVSFSSLKRIVDLDIDMSDLGENDGGETVFAEAWPPNQLEEDHVEMKTVRLSLF